MRDIAVARWSYRLRRDISHLPSICKKPAIGGSFDPRRFMSDERTINVFEGRLLVLVQRSTSSPREKV